MVLVDTSVWIRFLAGQAPYLAELGALLDARRAAGHDLVYGELLIADQGGLRKPLAAYELLRQAAMIPHTEVVGFVRDHRLYGRGVGWIDVHLLASSLAGRCELWTADLRLAALAREFRIAYEPAR